MTSDRNLLFGALAMQAGLITADEFAKACSIWSTRQEASLSKILCEQGWLVPEDQVHVEYLVERKLLKVGGDVRESFAGLPAEIRGVLATIGEDTIGPGSIGQTMAYEEGTASATWKPRPGQRYHLSTLHAAGGIGEIWLAHDADLERDVAVKRLQSQSAASEVTKLRFLREARITGQLDHPGVVPIYEICLDETSGQPYYSMRFLKGRTLTEVVRDYHQRRRQQGTDPQALLNLLNAFCIVCNTVAYAHSKGVVHRDLKCDNVILGDYGEVVVIDWGLAKEVGSYEVAAEAGGDTSAYATANPAATLAGHILGSPAYMAPEQAAGLIDMIGPRTDVYGLCAILYEILCGQPPFVGKNALEVITKVADVPPERPSDVAPGIPEGLERICLKGLEKLPSRRHRSADSVAQAVHSWVSDLAERRQAEEERERFFALSLDLLAIVGEDGQLRQVSPAWERLLGYDRHHLLERPVVELIHPDDRHLVIERFNAVVDTANGDTLEVRALHVDGSYRWVSWNATPIVRERCVYLVGRDITELKRSQRLFEGVLQSAPDAMVLINRQREIVMVNKQAEHVFGYGQDELLGQPIELLVPERHREQHPTHVDRFFATASVRPMGGGLSLRGRRKNGTEFEVDIALSPIDIEDNRLVAASVRDVSRRSRPA